MMCLDSLIAMDVGDAKQNTPTPQKDTGQLGELENEFLCENTFSINLVDNCMKHVIICLPQPSQTNIQSGAGYRCQ